LTDTTAHTIKFSVVIAAYNAEATIAKTITSCLQQTYPAFEIIVVDDCSTDNTGSIIAEQFGAQVRYTKMHKNFGPATARNKGIDMATGNYIAFLDADDVWHTEKLFICATILEARPGIRFLYHAYTLQNVEQIKISEGCTLYKLPFIKLLYRNIIATPCAVIQKNGLLFNPDMRYMEDYDLWLRTTYKYKAYFINLPLTQLGRPILSKGGASSNKWKMRKGEIKAYTRIVRLQPLFIFLLPFLYVLSILKFLYKAAIGS